MEKILIKIIENLFLKNNIKYKSNEKLRIFIVNTSHSISLYSIVCMYIPTQQYPFTLFKIVKKNFKIVTKTSYRYYFKKKVGRYQILSIKHLYSGIRLSRKTIHIILASWKSIIVIVDTAHDQGSMKNRIKFSCNVAVV